MEKEEEELEAQPSLANPSHSGKRRLCSHAGGAQRSQGVSSTGSHEKTVAPVSRVSFVDTILYNQKGGEEFS